MRNSNFGSFSTRLRRRRRTRHLYSALMFQPRIIGGLVALGIVLQTPWLFLALSAVLWWSALVPTLNRSMRSTTTLWPALAGFRHWRCAGTATFRSGDVCDSCAGDRVALLVGATYRRGCWRDCRSPRSWQSSSGYVPAPSSIALRGAERHPNRWRRRSLPPVAARRFGSVDELLPRSLTWCRLPGSGPPLHLGIGGRHLGTGRTGRLCSGDREGRRHSRR